MCVEAVPSLGWHTQRAIRLSRLICSFNTDMQACAWLCRRGFSAVVATRLSGIIRCRMC